jgi:hypothetical protein
MLVTVAAKLVEHRALTGGKILGILDHFIGKMVHNSILTSNGRKENFNAEIAEGAETKP